MNQHPCIIVPVSEVDSFRKQIAQLPARQVQTINEQYRMLVVPDHWYTRINSAYNDGELQEVLKGGPESLEHWCKLGDNSVAKSADEADLEWL